MFVWQSSCFLHYNFFMFVVVSLFRNGEHTMVGYVTETPLKINTKGEGMLELNSCTF